MKKPGLTRTELSWMLYDVGNSAFVLVVVTTIMPIFFKDIASAGVPDAVSTANWGFANSFASLILALLAPVMGTFADYKGSKKRFFAFFALMGMAFTLLLPVVGEGDWRMCIFLFVAARVGWAGANIFYDSFIVDVAPPERMDRVSAYGYAFGYIGSVIPFLVIIGLLMSGSGDSPGTLPQGPAKIGFVIVALWWLLFSIPLVKNVRQVHFIPPSSTPVADSFRRLADTFSEIRQHRSVFLFLLAYFLYIDGVDTVISMAAAYGRDIGLGVGLLIAVVLFIQVIAFPFAVLYGRLAERFSAKRMIMAGIFVYCIITLISFLLPSFDPSVKVALFWVLSFLVGSSMGGIQALSRSYFGKLIPLDRSAEFFGFYNIFGKFATITGPFLMGVVGMATGQSRWGILSILILFVAGAWVLSRVDGKAPDA